MTKKKPPLTPDRPRTQRTREHVIADLSVNFVERFILEATHSVLRVTADYGYDLIMQTFDEQGYAEEGFLYLQLKATDAIAKYERKESFAFPIEMRHYNLWRREHMPVFFILYNALRRRAYWLYTQAYFALHPHPRPQAQSLALHIPKKNVLGMRTIQRMREYKARILAQAQGGIHHHD